MFERQVEIATNDGRMSTFVCHPERGGPHSTLIFLMDAPGIREELRDMARRLGCVGYHVMLPNLYYRSNVEELGSVVGEANIATRQRALELMTTINIPKVMQDIDALVAFAETDQAASKGPMGCVGYCMSGPYAINAAARHPERIRAAASMYGVALVTDRADSPHLAAQRTDARLYFGCAENDHYAPLEMVEKLRAELAAKRANAEVEIYPGAQHGFAFPSRPAYDKPSAERHWERLFTLFGAELK
ncbi:MAG: carboxymethylenebutenolidase [Gammaproteobacteria bacterium]|nr:carboxymethylenebutenolidase [Gammaproteobacteria bacterium]